MKIIPTQILSINRAFAQIASGFSNAFILLRKLTCIALSYQSTFSLMRCQLDPGSGN